MGEACYGSPSALTKSEKRVSRELIERGLQRECERFLEDIRKLANASYEDAHARYIDIYRKTESFDKHVARRYDDMRGSRYLHCVALLVRDGVLSMDEIVGYSEENLKMIHFMSGIVD